MRKISAEMPNNPQQSQGEVASSAVVGDTRVARMGEIGMSAGGGWRGVTVVGRGKGIRAKSDLAPSF
jgi:hypothetical protein